MLKKDSIVFGVILGVLLPALLFLILNGAGSLIDPSSFLARPFEGYKPILFSLLVNLVTIRIYFVNLKMDRTGRGILLATFLIALAYFTFFKHI